MIKISCFYKSYRFLMLSILYLIFEIRRVIFYLGKKRRKKTLFIAYSTWVLLLLLSVYNNKITRTNVRYMY